MYNNTDTSPPVARLNDLGNEPEHQEGTTIAAEPLLEEPSAAYPVPPPTSTTGPNPFLEANSTLGPAQTSQEEALPSSEVPHLPPRPSNEHPTWVHEPAPAAHIDASPMATTNAPVTQLPQHVDPTVALKSMFPDFDDTVLQSVLESVNGNQDAAVDVLLGMSDPSYVSSHHSVEAPVAHANPSLDLDEQLARQLMLEDQRQQQAFQNQHQGQRARGQNWPRRGEGEVPYQARQGHPHPEGQSPPLAGSERGEFQEIKETFNQIAESGKRTFSSIVSKVKAKINEYDQSKPSNSNNQHPPPSWGVSSTSSNPQPQDPSTLPSYYSPDPTPASRDRHTTSQAYARYYATGDTGPEQGRDEEFEDMGGEGWTPIRHGKSPTGAQQQQPVLRGYDVDMPSPVPSPASPPMPTAAALSSPGAPARIASPPAASSTGEPPRPPPTSSGSPINAAKLGLLPKRPVSLLRPQSASPPARHPEDEEEDELDYVENPFEDARK